MTLFLLSGAFAVLGLCMIMTRRTVFGLVLAIHLLGSSVTLAFVSAGLVSGKLSESYVFAFLVILVGVAQLVAGYALSVRLFYLKRRIGLDELRSLRQ